MLFNLTIILTIPLIDSNSYNVDRLNQVLRDPGVFRRSWQHRIKGKSH